MLNFSKKEMKFKPTDDNPSFLLKREEETDHLEGQLAINVDDPVATDNKYFLQQTDQISKRVGPNTVSTRHSCSHRSKLTRTKTDISSKNPMQKEYNTNSKRGKFRRTSHNLQQTCMANEYQIRDLLADVNIFSQTTTDTYK